MKISVIVPVYNAERYLDKLVQSVLSQTYEDYELILVDDSSKDNSYLLMKKYQEMDSRIKAYTKENTGPGLTRKFGFEKSSGDLFFFVDSDDWVTTSDVFREINDLFEKNEKIDVLFFDREDIIGDTKDIIPGFNETREGELSISTQKMVEKMIMALKPENLGQVSKMDENICVVLVSQNSNLLLAEEIWKEKIKFQQRILSAGRRDLPDKMLRCLIRKIVKYDKEPISETLYTIYGEKIIPYVYEELYLEAFDKNINIDHWMMLLLKDQKKLMENLVCFSDMGLVQRILLLIDTYQDQNLYALDRENWRKLYKKIKEHGDLSKELAVQFLPVTLKTNYLDDELKQIISPVYEMLKNNTIDFEQWNKIQVLLPEVEAYQSYVEPLCSES